MRRGVPKRDVFARRLRCEALEDRRMLSIAGFETGLDGWMQGSGDDGDWTRQTGGTPSGSTGPSAAYSGSYYLYTEASSSGSPGSPNKSAYLNKTFDFSTFNHPELSFYYHMYGNSMGTLFVDVDDGSGWDSDVWHRAGQQHTSSSVPWTQATVDLSAYASESAVTIRLRGVTGSTFTSDMAIDHVELVNLDPDSPTVTSISPASVQLISSTSIDIDVTFSEEVQGVDATDLVLSNTAAAVASVGTPIDQGGNTWRFPISGLVGGTLDVSLAPDAGDIEDLAGNDLDPSPTQWNYNVTGSTAPTAVDLVAASDTGISDSDNITNLDNSTAAKALQFEVSGTIAGATVTVYCDGTAIGSVLAAGTNTVITTNGSYDIVDGSRSITARQSEVGKAGSDSTVAINVTFDSQAPETAIVDLQADSDTGPSDTDNITSDTTPTFDIAAMPYYRLYRDGVQIGGDYETSQIYSSAALPDGTYEFTILAFDEAGNETLSSPTLNVTIDTVAPDVSGIVPDMQATSDKGISDIDNLTCDNTPTFDVAGTPYFRFFLDGTEISSGYQSGSYSIPAQMDGTYSVAVIAVDEAGHESALGDPLSVTIETVAPAAPTVAPDLQASSDSGISDTDNITNDSTPTFDIVAAGYYRLYRDEVVVCNYETVSSCTVPVQPDGTYEYTVVAVDEAGNESAPSPALNVSIDTTAPEQSEYIAKFTADDGAAEDWFGCSVSISGTTAIVGAWGDDDNGGESGSAYIFEQTATGWEQVAKLTADDGAAFDGFGYSVSISGTTAIVGARYDDDNGISSGSAYIFEETASGWQQIAKLTAVYGAAGDWFGYSVSISGTTAIVGAWGDDDNGDFSGSAYIFHQTPSGWEQVAKLMADDGAAGDSFGESVSISGTMAIVGARGNDDNGSVSGSAYMFQETAGGWEQVAKLTADDGAEGDGFGYSVSINDTTAIVGADHDDGNGSDSGSAYIFEKTASGWEQVTKLTSDDGAANDRLGYSVSISGTTAIVGACGDDDNGDFSGSAYIFHQTPSGWEQVDKLTANDGALLDLFGVSVSISGTTAIVGAYHDNDNGYSSGSAYMFSSQLIIDLQAASDTGPCDTDNITADTTPAFDIEAAPYYRLYRNGVQISGDYETAQSYTSEILPDGTYNYTIIAIDGAGNQTLSSPMLSVTIDTVAPDVSGIVPDMQAASDKGISDTDNLTCDTMPTFDVPGTPCYRFFLDGTEISSGYQSGSYTIPAQVDGIYGVAVIAVDEAGNESTLGNPLSVTIETVAPPAPLTAPDLQAESDTGISGTDNLTNDNTPTFDVSFTGYYHFYRDDVLVSDGYGITGSYTAPAQPDGTYDYAIVAVDEAGNESALGPALEVTIDTVAPEQADYIATKLLADDIASGDYFGYSVSIDGTTAIVGAYYNDDNDGNSGSVYVFEHTSTGWEQIVKLTAYDGTSSDYFGRSVSISGTTAIVGAKGDDDNGNSSGSAYIFQQTTSGWEQVAKLTADDGAALDGFGSTVSISGTRAIVGATGDDDKGYNSGSVYMFELTATGWEQVAKLTADDGAAEDAFGYSVSIDGITAIVGVRADDDNGSYSGSAYIFEQTATGWEQVTKLTAADAASYDGFGYSVSISGTSAIVGADNGDGNSTNSGSAYIFEHTVTGWEQVAKLTADDGEGGDNFGCSVSISGAKAIVGAQWDDDNSHSSGSAYIFEQTVTGWEQVVKLTADDGAADDYFGASVSISGTIAIVGAYGDDDNGDSSGSVYVFPKLPAIDLQAASDTGPIDTDNITSITAPTFDIVATPYYRIYRNGVQISSDLETAPSYTSESLPDGIYNYTIIAIDEAGNETLPNSVLNITIDTVAPDVLDFVPDLQSASDTGISDTDNLTNDTTPTFEVADSPYFRLYRDGIQVSGNNESGSYTTLSQPDGTYNYAITFVDEAGNESLLGDPLSVTIDTNAPPSPVTAPDLQTASDSGLSDTDNITNDTTPTLDINATGYYRLYRDTIRISDDFETTGSYTSPVLSDGQYEYTITAIDAAGNESAPSQTLEVTIDTVAPELEYVTTKMFADDAGVNNFFGRSVYLSGTTAIVGASGDDDNGDRSGSAYIFEQTAMGCEQVAKLTAADGAPFDGFGTSVSISCTTAIVGATSDDDNGDYSGSAYIFEQTVTGWQQVAKLTPDDGATYDRFGSSVSISGTTAIVGSSSNSGLAYIFKETASGWEQVAQLTVDDGATGGSSVSISGTTAIVGAIYGDGNIAHSGSAYIFKETANGWVQVAKLTADDGATDDNFGVSISISGSTVIVGANGDDDNGNNSGSAYIFEQTDTGWGQVAKLTSDDGATGDVFGRSVSISGTLAIVGANGSNSGSAYIFEQTVTGWEQVVKLTNDDGAESDVFGNSVSISGTSSVVGAFCSDENGYNSGLAYMISEWPKIDLQAASDTGISNTDNITHDNTPIFDVAASSYYRLYRDGVQISDDYETAPSYTASIQPDGTYEYTVRAFDEAGNETLPSPPLIVTIDTAAIEGIIPDLRSICDTGVSETDNLTNDNTPTLDITGTPYFRFFLDGVEISSGYQSGSYTLPALADGTYNVAVTAVDEAGNESALGDPLIVTIDTAAPNAPTVAPDLQASSDSGISDTDNITNDKTPTFNIVAEGYYRLCRDNILINVNYENANSFTAPAQPDGTYGYSIVAVDEAGNESSSGPILEVTIDTFAPLQSRYISDKLLSADGTAIDRFGYSVSIDGTTTIIGACGDDDNGGESGSAYIFEQTATGWEQVAKLTAADGSVADWFGSSVSISGTIAIVGAELDDDNGTNSGSAYVFERISTGWEQVAKLTADDGETFDYFGYSVAISGNTIIVGAYGSDDNGDSSGSAYIFQYNSTTWTQVAKLIADDASVDDCFGKSVSISGTTAIVGVEMDDDNGTNSGSAYVFEQTATGWQQVAKLMADDGTSGDCFGHSVSINGTMTIVGAYRGDGNVSYSGSAYVFEQTATGWEQAAKLMADDGIASDSFGCSVSISGTTVIVGASGDDDNGSSSGSVYAFEQTATGWEQMFKLTANDGAADDEFGSSIANSGTTAIVGVFRDDDNGSYSGSVQILSSMPSSHLQAASDTGSSDTDNITSNNTPTFDIGAMPYYRIYRDGVQISGDYETAASYTSPILPDGTYQYSVVAVDEAGNETLLSDPLSVTIDTSSLLPGDANYDGTVNQADAAIVSANWLMQSGATWSDGDFNGDGRVNDIDATLMAANWQRTVSPPDTSASVAVEPVSYDLDNDGQIGLGDLAVFASVYRQQPGVNTDSPDAYAADFDRSGTVDLGDLALFAAKYQQGQTGDSVVASVAPQTSLTMAVTPAILPGDANLDGRVDDVDAATLAGNWQKQSGAAWREGDFNGDGRVSDEDVAILARHWMMTMDDSDDDDERDAVFATIGAEDYAMVSFD